MFYFSTGMLMADEQCLSLMQKGAVWKRCVHTMPRDLNGRSSHPWRLHVLYLEPPFIRTKYTWQQESLTVAWQTLWRCTTLHPTSESLQTRGGRDPGMALIFSAELFKLNEMYLTKLYLCVCLHFSGGQTLWCFPRSEALSTWCLWVAPFTL